jgi:hypothetical protein
MESGENRPRPTLVKEETPKGKTVYIVYLDDKILGWAEDRETAMKKILVPARDGHKKVKRR